MRSGIIIAICTATIVSGSALADCSLPITSSPVICSDPLPDVPLAQPIGNFDVFTQFHNYSWRSFIALNWPAQAGAAGRGLADPNRTFADTDGPRVWMTWKSRHEIFQPGGPLPKPWASYDGLNPCGEGFANEGITLSSFGGFGDFNQALANPLVARNRSYVRYEVRVNEAEFDSIVGNKWYIASNLPNSASTVPFNTGSTAVKAAWRILTQNENTPTTRGRYYVARAQVFDFAQQKCLPQDVALVGLHIVTKTKDRPQWIWSTFEHIDNVPFGPVDGSPRCVPDTPADVSFSFYDRQKPKKLLPEKRPSPISLGNKPVADPDPMQVIRAHKIQTMRTNCMYWSLSEIKDTVWKNYMLVMTQWPDLPEHPGPMNDGNPFPGSGSDKAASNIAMETYFQDTGCMECHKYSNQHGRDFVMFVSFDTFRPGIRVPGDPFNDGNPLSHDPMINSLRKFYETLVPNQ